MKIIKKRKHGNYTNNFPNTYHIKTQRTAIGEAIARGDRHSVMILLKCKLIDLNKAARDIDGTEITTISLALKKGHLEIAKLLLEYKNKTRRDLDITKQYPKTLETPLHLAMLLEAKNQENAQQSVVVKLVNALKKEVKRKLEKEAKTNKKTNKKTNSTKNVMNPAFNSFLIQDCEGRTPLEVAVGAINYKLAFRKTLEAMIDIVEYKTKYMKTSDSKNNICKTLFKSETYKPYEAYSNNQIRSLFALTYHNTDSSTKSDVREKHSLDKFEYLLEQTSKYLEEKHFRKILEEIRHACKDIQIIRCNHADKLLGITINYLENYKLFPRPPESISCINANIYFRLVYWLRAF